MVRGISTWNLHAALKAEGFPLPDECADVHIEMPVNGLFQIVYRVNLTPEHLAALGRAMQHLSKNDTPHALGGPHETNG